MRTLEIILDHLPDKRLSPNAREHFMRKASVVADIRKEAWVTARNAWGSEPAMKQARIIYKFIVTTRGRRDVENLLSSCKGAVDGIVDAGVLVDDSWQHLSIGGASIELGEKEQTVITIKEI